MSHTNSTTNYNLPQFITTDKPGWLTDVNAAYSAIDLGMKTAQDKADNAQNTATSAGSTATSASTTANSADSKASGALASLAPTFLTTNTYNVGDIVIYDNLMYQCVVDVITPGAWTGNANWTRLSASQFTMNDLADVSASNIQVGDILIYEEVSTNVYKYVPVDGIPAKKGSVTINKGVYGGYISSSRNYFDFFIPMNTKGISTVTVDSFASITVFTSSGRSDNPFDAYVVTVTESGLFVDCHYSSTQPSSVSGSVSFDNLILIIT